MKSVVSPFPARSVLLVMLFGCSSSYCVAQQPPPLSAPPLPRATPRAPQLPGTPPSQSVAPTPDAPSFSPAVQGGMAELKFNNAALDIVLNFYSELSGKTVIPSPAITGNITLRTNGRVSREEAQSLIEGQLIRACNVALVEDGKVLIAVPVDKVPCETLTIVDYDSAPPSENARGAMMRRFSLKYLTPADAQKLLQPLLTAWGRLQPVERLNSILITDTAPNLRKMKALLNEGDQPVASPNQMHSISLKHRRPSTLKAEIESLFSMPAFSATSSYVPPSPTPPVVPGIIRTPRVYPPEVNTEPPFLHGSLSIMADDDTGLLVFICRPETMAMIKQLIASLDVKIAEPDASRATTMSNFAKEQAAKTPVPPAAK